MGYQLNHVCNKPKAFELERTQHDVITWLFHFEETLNTGKPFTQKSFSRNNLWVERKTPSLALGKVTPCSFMCFALHYIGCVSLTKVAVAAFEKLASCFTPQVVAHDKTRIEEAHRCCAMFLYHLDGGDHKRGRAQYKWQRSSNSSKATNQAQIPYQRK